MTGRSGVRRAADRAAEWLTSRTPLRPRLALVLGSGLGGAVCVASEELAVGFVDVPGLIAPSAEGHPGRLIVGRLHGLAVAVFEGRLHLYEGVGSEGISLMAAFMARIGVRAVVLTSACGGLSPALKVGDFVVVRDHVVYPLGGGAWALGRRGEPAPGTRAPAWKDAGVRGASGTTRGAARAGGYDRLLSETLERACMERGARWSRGVFGYATGPCYETPAEARALRMAGADVVSMSAAADALAAGREGLHVACLCCVTNTVGLWKRARSGHEDVLAAARSAAETMGAVLDRFVQLAALGGMD